MFFFSVFFPELKPSSIFMDSKIEVIMFVGVGPKVVIMKCACVVMNLYKYPLMF